MPSLLIRGGLSLLLCAALDAARFDIAAAGRIVRLADPQIAPDGRRIAVVVSRANFADNRFDAELVLVDTATRAQQVLTRNRRGVAQPRWSPDGSRLAFLAAVENRAQIFVLPLSGGDALQLTHSTGGVRQFAWSPDGARIAYVLTDEAVQRSGEEAHNRSFEAGNNDFLVTAAPLPSHVWLIDAAGGRPRRVSSGSWTLPVSLPPSPPPSPLSWSPDGRSLAITRVESPYTGDADGRAIHILDVDSGTTRALTGRTRFESQPQFSPDGRRVSYWYPRGGQPRNVNEIFVAPVEGGEGRSVTAALDRNVMRAIWLKDSRSMLVSANDGTTVGLWVQPVDGPARRIPLGDVVPTATFWLDASVNGKDQIAFTGSEAQRPTELYLLESPSSQPIRLTGFNDATAALELGRTETLEWDGPDGFRMDGVVTYPPGFTAGVKYPLVLYIHGGPRSASKRAFSSRAQLLAAEDWIVFEPNYRGSDNLGNALQAAIWNDAGKGPGRDIMSGVEVLRKRGLIDEKRMAVSGWSYGGFMTTWLLGNYPEAWAAGVAGAAVTNLLDQYTIGDSNVQRGQSWGGSPYTDPKRMQAVVEQSPMTYAPRIRAPTLILALTGDYRVPITQSYQLYHALRDNHIPTQFVAYPLPGHSPADPIHQRDVDRRWLDWLRRHLGNQAR